MNPLFSIITVTFNAERTIPHTLSSVKEQTFSDFEYIIMDGASSDATVNLVREANIPNCKITSEPDKGLYDAMNKAMDRAAGKYFIFLNAGDSFTTPHTLGDIANAVIANEYPGVVYGQTQLIDTHRNYIGPRHLTAPEHLTYNSFSNGMLVCHQAFIALAKITSHYDTRYRYSADYEWCIRCLQHSRKNIYLPETIINYLNEGVTTANHKASLMERFRIMRHYYGTITAITKHISFIPRYLQRNKRSNTSNN